MKKYICIEGIIGCGKTSLAKHLFKTLSPTQNAVLLKEQFEKNKLLELFYQSAQRYNLLTEYSFLIERFHQIHHHFSTHFQSLTIADFTFRKCLWFAENNLSPNDFKEYQKYFFLLEESMNTFPDIILFLDVKPAQAFINIKKRNRKMEQNITLSYLENLYHTYIKYLNALPYPTVSISVKNYETLADEALKIILSV